MGVLGLAVLATLLVWLDDVHVSTTNGMYKSIRLEPWIKSFSLGQLDYSNYMYYPLMALLCRGLDLLGIYQGMAWKQLAVVNVLFGAICLGIIFALVRHLTGRRDVALLAATLHLGSAFFLTLSITSEDVLPGYTLVLAAMALSVAWFDRPTVRRVIVVGALFTFGWLLEWRLLFPALPALGLAIALAPLPLKRRAALIGVLVLSILVTAEIVCLFWDGHEGSGQIDSILWTGKGLDTGWAGLAMQKLTLVPSGIGEYLFGGRNLASADDIRIHQREWASSLVVLAVLLAMSLAVGWRERRLRLLLAVFLTAFIVGEVFNLYSQPQDPQMQVNIMAWVTAAWAVVLAACLPTQPGSRRLVFFTGAAALSLVPLVYNIEQLRPNRGSDSAQLAVLREIEQRVDPARTVFLYFGFESINSWQFLLWTRRWAGVCDVGPAPTPSPKLKWISVVHTLIAKPEYSSAEHAAALKREIECALNNGYTVLASDVWVFSLETLTGHLIALSGAQHAQALHAALHDDYEARELFTTPRTSPFYELKRR